MDGPQSAVAFSYLVGTVSGNTLQNMMTWQERPQSIVPGNAVPDMGLTSRQAGDVAVYFYTLE